MVTWFFVLTITPLPQMQTNYPLSPGACLPCTITVQGLPEAPPAKVLIRRASASAKAGESLPAGRRLRTHCSDRVDTITDCFSNGVEYPENLERLEF